MHKYIDIITVHYRGNTCRAPYIAFLLNQLNPWGVAWLLPKKEDKSWRTKGNLHIIQEAMKSVANCCPIFSLMPSKTTGPNHWLCMAL